MECKGHTEADKIFPRKTKKREVADQEAGNTFSKKVAAFAARPLHAVSLETLQVNLGYKCNMSCRHCHISAGPHRHEMMTIDNIDRVLYLLDENPIKNLDLTGGAPELHPHFRYVVGMAKAFRKKVLVRCNLTVIFEQGMAFLPSFYREHKVELIASLPSFERNGVERMRGPEVFDKSIEALRILNEQGYGRPGSGLLLHLVHNPNGAYLPPEQKSLEKRYMKILYNKYGLSFNSLFTFANMPIGRFKDFLNRSGNYETYMAKLRSAFNPATLDGIMCRYMLNVGWDGSLYDCDFNQVAGCGVAADYPANLQDFDYERLLSRPLAFKEHCFGCTAGQGSS
jgi:radical SAM/Cys-rich protein